MSTKSKEYYEKNKEIIKARNKAYKEKNKELIKARNKVYKEKNKKIISEKNKLYYKKNKEIINDRNKLYYENNRENIINKFKTYRKQYRELNKEKINKTRSVWDKKTRNINPIYKIKKNIRTSIYGSIKSRGFKKLSKTEIILGCSYEEFKLHIESLWESWMNWDNYGLYNGELNYGWDIDHIIPISSANTEEELIKLNHHTNLQPLCSKVNRDIKRDSI